jgi:protein-tyrosine phosphatase
MKYAIIFGLLGAMLTAEAILLGDVGWLLLWPGVSFLLVGAAYAGLGPRVFGKRPDGRMAGWDVLLLLPFLLLTWGVWHLWRLLSREPCWNEVRPRLSIGRRTLPHEMPPGVDMVVDLTAEFPEPRGVRQGREYVCLPILDNTAPDESSLRRLVERVVAWPGVVLVHCANGHRRSGLVVAAVLLARGEAADAAEAIKIVKAARPGVRLKKAQRELLQRAFKATR